MNQEQAMGLARFMRPSLERNPSVKTATETGWFRSVQFISLCIHLYAAQKSKCDCGICGCIPGSLALFDRLGSG